MNKFLASAVCAALLSIGGAAIAQDYNKVPAGDAQYRQCLSYAAKLYEGGNEKSPIAGQSKAQAWCTCMWNETPDDFKGNLVTFSETRKGKETNKTCEKYSDWGG
ncbi:MAG: hypothetical protein HYX47_01175 [Burkholderiales bacterium]|nr:hypothetical protein [Burkholderiales bacterium]